MIDILNILDKRCCAVDVCARSKPQMLHELAKLAVQSELLEGVDPTGIEEALSAREAEGSTGFGNEIAIPHARLERLEQFLLYIVSCRRGVGFDALDKQRVKLFFVILGPTERVHEHLQVLAFVSRTIGHTNVKSELTKARTATGLYETFLRHSDLQPRDGDRQRAIKLMLINIYEEEHLYGILEALLEEGIEGATIIDSVGMGQFISNNPLFSSFSNFMLKSRHTSKTILAMVPDGSIDAVVSAIESITGDLDSCNGAMALTLDLQFIKGNMNIL